MEVSEKMGCFSSCRKGSLESDKEVNRETTKVRRKERSETRQEKGKREKEGDERRKGRRE